MATVALVVGAAVTAAGMQWRASATEAQTLASQARTIKQLQQEVDNFEAFLRAHPEWSDVASRVEPSVVTVETDEDLGSGWVAHTDSSGSDIVTNFHVVEPAYTAGKMNVAVRYFDELLQGTITRVDGSDDLAVVHASEHLPALTTSAARPKPGQ